MDEQQTGLLVMSLHFGHNGLVKVLITPKDWDKLWNAKYAYLDETNNERAAELHTQALDLI